MASEQDMYVGLSRGEAAVYKAAVDYLSLADQLVAEVKALRSENATLKGADTTTTTPTVVPRNRVAVIGGYSVADSGALIASDFTSAPANFITATSDGRYNRTINTPDSAGLTTVQVIKNIRAAGREPDLWVIDLGYATDATQAEITALDTTRQKAQVDQVLAELGPNAKVMWVSMTSPYSYPNAWHQAENKLFQDAMTARGALGYYADLWAYVRDNGGTGHTITEAQKWAWLAGEVDKAMGAGSTSTSTTAATVVDRDYTAFLPAS